MAGGGRRFRFGVVGESIRSAEQVVAEAGRAEDLGYSTLLLRDHFQREPFGDQLAPLVALTAAARATSMLRVGTLVLDNDYRHPVLLAQEAATLDVLSGGRFELGIGAGWLREEYDRAGLPFDPAAVRVGRLEESVQVLKRLFAGDAVTFSGTHYTVTDMETFPRPAQRPHPPILVGAGSRRMLGIAGREADIVGILAQKIEWVREAAGDRFPDLELSTIVSVVVAEDHHAAAERLAARRGWAGLPAERVLDLPSMVAGEPDRIAEQLHARRERYGLSYFVVSDQDMAGFSPVVQRLSGG